MKSSSISNSNSVILSPREWCITAVLCAAVCTVVYTGWFRWERFDPGEDYRPSCWAERMSDYWSHYRWTRYAQSRYRVALIGDSVVWGQEVDNDQTLSHFLNENYGEKIFANMGIDGLFQAAEYGLIRYYGKYYTNILLQFSPYWLADVNRDLRGNLERFRHPRLVPQFNRRIHYNDYTLNERLGYKLEHYVRIFPLVRHIVTNYYDNMSVAAWMMEHPYVNPFSALTFQADEVTREKRGEGLNWETQNMRLQDFGYIPISESVQFECFLKTITMLKKRDIGFFVLIGPYNPYILTPGSRARLDILLEAVKRSFLENRIPFFDAGSKLPSEELADGAGHMLSGGHDMLAKEMLRNEGFREWLSNIRH